MLEGWRIAAPAYATSADAMLSGEGAFLYGGRWNHKGVRVVYLGSSLAQAAMELIVHLGRPDILKTYHTLSVSFDEALMSHIDILDLPDNWAEASMAPAVQAVGTQWVKNATSLMLQVPSGAVNGAYNYLLNPLHEDRIQLNISEIGSFGFDQRLIK